MDYENEFIIGALRNFAADLKTGKPECEVIDSYACKLTYFMQGRVAQALMDKEGK